MAQQLLLCLVLRSADSRKLLSLDDDRGSNLVVLSVKLDFAHSGSGGTRTHKAIKPDRFQGGFLIQPDHFQFAQDGETRTHARPDPSCRSTHWSSMPTSHLRTTSCASTQGGSRTHMHMALDHAALPVCVPGQGFYPSNSRICSFIFMSANRSCFVRSRLGYLSL